VILFVEGSYDSIRISYKPTHFLDEPTYFNHVTPDNALVGQDPVFYIFVRFELRCKVESIQVLVDKSADLRYIILLHFTETGDGGFFGDLKVLDHASHSPFIGNTRKAAFN
jgi:hypothetical protein